MSLYITSSTNDEYEIDDIENRMRHATLLDWCKKDVSMELAPSIIATECGGYSRTNLGPTSPLTIKC